MIPESAPATNPHPIRNPHESVILQSVSRAGPAAAANTATSTNHYDRHRPAVRNPPFTDQTDPNVIRNPVTRYPRNDYCLA